jgi:thiol-disulfide isomerase/thioredoxin
LAQPTSSPFRTWLAIGLAFTVIWIAGLALFGPKRPPALDVSSAGRMAAFDWSLFDLSDQSVSFSRFKGKTIFLNIWATWCPPCVAEMPSIARLALAPKLQGKPIEFVCVSTDESSAAVRSYLEGRSWTMTFLRANELPPAFQTDGIPATFIIGPDGRIAASEAGSADWDTPAVIELLEKLSTAKAAQPNVPAPSKSATD